MLDHASPESEQSSLFRLTREFARQNIPIETELPLQTKAGDLIVVAGGGNASDVIANMRHLRELGLRTIYALDTAAGVSEIELRSLADRLEKERFHFKQTEAILYLLNSAEHFVYAYPKADVAASIVVIFQATNRVLLVRRKNEPFGGMLALPGGFLRPLIEDLPGCASRELHEETGLCIPKAMLTPLSVRSNPGRDTRGHVIDHGFLALLSREEERMALLQLQADDDAEEVMLLPVKQALLEPLAADHKQILEEAIGRRSVFKENLANRFWSFFVGITAKVREQRAGAAL